MCSKCKYFSIVRGCMKGFAAPVFKCAQFEEFVWNSAIL